MGDVFIATVEHPDGECTVMGVYTSLAAGIEWLKFRGQRQTGFGAASIDTDEEDGASVAFEDVTYTVTRHPVYDRFHQAKT